jgi:hypothetical protein
MNGQYSWSRQMTVKEVGNFENQFFAGQVCDDKNSLSHGRSAAKILLPTETNSRSLNKY